MKKVVKKKGILLLVCSILLLFGACQSAKTYDAKLYCVISVSGFNGYGGITVALDTTSIMTLYGDLLAEADTDTKVRYDKLMQSLTYKLESEDVSGTLSNGDKVKIQMGYDKEIAKELKIAFSNSEWEYEITGLEEAREIDPFENLKLEFSGVAPNGKVSFDVLECDDFVRQSVMFSANTSSLSNGTKFIVTADCLENILLKEKVILKQKEKEYEASGLGEYPITLKGVDISEVYAKLYQNMDEHIALLSNWSFSSGMGTWEKFTYEVEEQNLYFIIRKDNPTENKLAAVYKATAQGTNASSWAYDTDSREQIPVGEVRTETKYFYVLSQDLDLFVIDGKAVVYANEIFNNYYIESNKDFETAKNAVTQTSNSYSVTEVPIP